MAIENTKKEVHKILWEQTGDFDFKERREEWSKFTELFNDNPKSGYEFLSSSGLGSEKEPSHLAIIFHNCLDLDNVLLTQELVKRRKDVLVCFLDYFKFDGMDLLSALRELFSTIGLPGENSMIEVLLETFSRRYLTCNPEFLQNSEEGSEEERKENIFPPQDIVCILCFSSVLLSDDRNVNSKTRKRMTLKEYLSWNQNYGAPTQLLTDIFLSLQEEPLSFGQRGGKNMKGTQRNNSISSSPTKKKGFFSSWL